MRISSLLWRYGASLTFVAFALGLTLATPPLAEAPYCLFFAAAVFSAWCGGLGPGLLATGLSVLALDFFFIHPIYSLGTNLADGIRLTVFGLVAVVIASLQEQRRRLEESLRLRDRHRGEQLAVVAHEMRNVLAPMASALAILRAPEANSDLAGRSRELLGRQVVRMTRLIEDLMDAASAEQGKLRLRCQRVDLRAVVENAVESVRPDAEGRGHLLEARVPPAAVWVDADERRLEQIVVNLLTNAVKYTDPGGRILLSLEQTASGARVRVRDTGVGLPAEAAAGVFELFAQAGGGSRGGLGIGLSLAQQLARLHGGGITVSSDGPGRGCEFVLHLPAHAAHRMHNGSIAGISLSAPSCRKGPGSGATFERHGGHP
jgi:signal transduction histidine kinase